MSLYRQLLNTLGYLPSAEFADTSAVSNILLLLVNMKKRGGIFSWSSSSAYLGRHTDRWYLVGLLFIINAVKLLPLGMGSVNSVVFYNESVSATVTLMRQSCFQPEPL